MFKLNWFSGIFTLRLHVQNFSISPQNSGFIQVIIGPMYCNGYFFCPFKKKKRQILVKTLYCISLTLIIYMYNLSIFGIICIYLIINLCVLETISFLLADKTYILTLRCKSGSKMTWLVLFFGGDFFVTKISQAFHIPGIPQKSCFWYLHIFYSHPLHLKKIQFLYYHSSFP